MTLVYRVNGQPVTVKPGAVQIEPGDAQPLGHGDRLPRGVEQVLGRGRFDQSHADVAARRELYGSLLPQLLQRRLVLPGPVLELDLHVELGQPPDAVKHGQIHEDHLGAHRQVEGAVSPLVAHASVDGSRNETGAGGPSVREVG